MIAPALEPIRRSGPLTVETEVLRGGLRSVGAVGEFSRRRAWALRERKDEGLDLVAFVDGQIR